VLKQKVKKVKDTLKRNAGVVENFGYLSILQVFSTLVPLITYPYLVKVLGTELYGLVIFAQSITLILANLIDYGFNIAAVKEVAEHRDDKEKLSEIVSSVYLIKFFFWVLSFGILVALIQLVPKLSLHPVLYLLAFTSSFTQFLFPQWLFQGLENMRYTTIVNICSRLIFLILIFVVVKAEDDFLIVPLLSGLGAFVGGIIGLYIVIFREKIKFQIQSVNTLKFYIKGGSSMFGFRLSGIIKTQTNQLLLGFLTNYSLLTYYDLAMKITSIFSTVFNNYTAVFFPNITNTKNIALAKKALHLSAVLSISTYIILALLLKALIIFWNPEFIPTVKVFWIVGLFIPVYAIASFLGNSFLVAHGFQKQHLFSTAWTTFVYLGAVYIFYITNNVTIFTLALSMFLSQFLSTAHKYYYCKKYDLL
jgi:PST family polysaccharide transporter